MSENSYIRGLSLKPTHPFREMAEELKEKFEKQTTVSEDGIVRWKSNGKVPPKEVLEFWDYINKPFDFNKSFAILKKEKEKFLNEYIESRKNYVPSKEELYEMTAAFGPGQTVVDVITGKQIKL